MSILSNIESHLDIRWVKCAIFSILSKYASQIYATPYWWYISYNIPAHIFGQIERDLVFGLKYCLWKMCSWCVSIIWMFDIKKTYMKSSSATVVLVCFVFANGMKNRAHLFVSLARMDTKLLLLSTFLYAERSCMKIV